MKKRYLAISFIATALVASSCNEFLNIDPTDKVTEKLVWADVATAELAINYFYGDIPNLGSFSDYQCSIGLTEGLTDEFKYGNMNYNAFCFIPNEVSYGGTVLTASYVDSYLGVWGTTYEQIRRVNETLGKLHASGFDEAEKQRLEGELRFFRAMYYFELLKRYHQAILYDEDLSKIATDKAFDSEEAGWNYVLSDLNYAAEHLPVQQSATGRLTSGAAYALISRAMLYCNNWDAVKKAAKKIFAMGYKLTDQYADAFKGDGNSEAIYTYVYGNAANTGHSFDSYYAPGGDHSLGMPTHGGFGTPTQDLVEEYELKTGGKADWTAWHASYGTLQAPPYDQLEPRFAATILYNGVKWRDRTIEPFVGGKDGWATWMTDAITEGRTTTGYYLRKFLDEKRDYKANSKSTQPWIAFRLAEVYLNYAEACLRTNDLTEAATYINKVRKRPGVNLPELQNLTTVEKTFNALRHERKIELAFEGLYYWDMRRWGLATTQLSGIRRHGLKIVKSGNDYRYLYVEVDNEDLNYRQKMNRFPVPLAELNTNKEMKQFSEWK